MPSQIWSGSLTFGLVNLPVSLVSAVRPRPAALRMLHADDAEPLERRMHCPECDSGVPASEQVRGFRVESGEYVEVTEDEMESLAPECSQAIEIDRFVDLEDIDPLYFDRPYFLLPDKGAEKPYGLLVDALAKMHRAGIAKLVFSAGQHLVAVMARGDILELYALRFARQVVAADDLERASNWKTGSGKASANCQAETGRAATAIEPPRHQRRGRRSAHLVFDRFHPVGNTRAPVPGVDAHRCTRTRRIGQDGVHAPAYDAQAFIEVAFDNRAHRVQLVVQAGFAHDARARGNGLAEMRVAPDRRDAEFDYCVTLFHIFPPETRLIGPQCNAARLLHPTAVRASCRRLSRDRAPRVPPAGPSTPLRRGREDAALRARLRKLAEQYPRYGYPTLHGMLRLEGLVRNAKRTCRIYREEGLQVRTKRRKKLTRAAVLNGGAQPTQRTLVDELRRRSVGQRPAPAGAQRGR